MDSSAPMRDLLASSSTTSGIVMALTKEQLDSIEFICVSRYGILITYSVLIYEWVACFQDEVKLIYRRRWSYVSMAYTLCRYYPLLMWGVVAWSYTFNHTPGICKSAVRPVHALQLPLQLFGQAVMVMRAYVFSERSNLVLAILLSGYGVLVGAVAYLFLTDVPLPVHNPSSPVFLLGKSGCFPDYSEKAFGLRIGLALVSAMLVDSLNLLVVSFYSWKRSRYGRSKLTCFFSKQGLNAFVWMTVSNVITLALYFSQDNGIGVPFVLVISNIFACRIILQLRSGSWQTGTQLSRDNSQMIRDALAKLPPPQDEWAVSVDLSAEDEDDAPLRRSGEV
ncbi:unnamed protein product [Cyclocybe aegerita]|uniref:DUF6533 domain-containing protein n=1 Tax=Cyclocybe aegerita TaxID=1973307 RepID=A0A8S0VWK3_CYCAE|nr:unnamed protein product [Cyclocybe aegerita]